MFVSAALGFSLYVMSLPVVLSIWGYGGGVVADAGVLTTGIGSGIGSYATWFDRDHELSVHVLLLVMRADLRLHRSVVGLPARHSIVDSSGLEARVTGDQHYLDGRCYQARMCRCSACAL